MPGWFQVELILPLELILFEVMICRFRFENLFLHTNLFFNSLLIKNKFYKINSFKIIFITEKSIIH